MIDLNDEKQKYFYLNKCLNGRDIDFYSFKIVQPLVGDIMDDESFYDAILSPFISGRTMYNAPSYMSLFECVMNTKETRIGLLLAINYFMKIELEHIKVCEYPSMSKKLNRPYYRIIINNSILFDEDKFEDLKKIILMINKTKEVNKSDIKEEFKCKDNNYNEKFNKLFKNRNKSKEKRESYMKIKLANVYDYIVHCQDSIDYEKPLKWTIYQLYNTYQNKHIKENTMFLYDVASNGMLDSKEKLKPYSELILK